VDRSGLISDYLACAGATGCRYGDPRTLYATLRYRW
jgi:iron complex outermembrane receptor protein